MPRAILLLVVVAVQAFAASSLRAGAADKRLDIYWIDVEGGGATLVVTPAGESVLIDTGFPGGRDGGRIFDVASGVAGLKRIDHLVITHYHLDHFGGAAVLSTLMPIGTVYDNGDFKEGWEKPSKEYLEFKADKRVVLNPGDELPLSAAADAKSLPVTIKCLAARQKTVPAPPDAPQYPDCARATRQRPDYSDNANSIALLLTFGPFRFFDGGDLTWNHELKLVCPVKLVPEVDVYQVNHHGQATSNNPLLVAALSPTVAVMNNGPRKGGQPPTFATLKAQSSIQALYAMHRNVKPGEEEANTSKELTANLEEACAGNYIKLSAEPDGSAYTISIPATGHSRTFEAKPTQGALPRP